MIFFLLYIIHFSLGLVEETFFAYIIETFINTLLILSLCALPDETVRRNWRELIEFEREHHIISRHKHLIFFA